MKLFRSWTALLACAVVTPVCAHKLTIERIFAAPDLSGATLQSPQISPGGKRVTFLRGKEDNKDQLDLWEYDVASGRTRMLVDSRQLVGSEGPLSEEETQRRERQRISALSGIVEYLFAPNGKALLFPLGGDLYYYRLSEGGLADRTGNPVKRLTQTEGFETDPRFSPRGRYISFIRDQNLFVIDLRSGEEHALTTDGGGPIKNGMAEFIAQEEMDRDTGYWWSPDDGRIAFTRTDESPVPEHQRFEIGAEDVRVFNQRYPAAGTRNVLIELKVIDLKTNAVANIDLGNEKDIYLARVDWFPNGKHLAVQRQPRDQQRLDLLKADVNTGATTILLTETGKSWVPLHHELTFLKRSPQFIWASSRSGYRHLYLYDTDGTLIRPLTAGPWMVVGDGGKALLSVDESRDRVYFVANERTPIERHLYWASLRTTTPRKIARITQESGWHRLQASPDRRFFLDTFSTPTQPPQVRLLDPDGSVRAVPVENTVDESHPYHNYMHRHITPEFGTLAAGDGQTLHYQLYKPQDLDPSRRYPVVVDVYGGPNVQRVRRAWGGTAGFFHQVLAQGGFVVFLLDNRGSGMRGDAFESTLHLRMGKVETEDQVLGTQYLSALPYVDPKRIGIFGWSYGGYMTLMTMFTAPDVFRAGVSGAPVTDWRLYDTHYTERYLGLPQANGAGYEASGVFPYAKDLKGPLLILHGMADDNVLFSNSTKLFKKLQDLNKPFDVMTYPGGKHGLLRHKDTGPHGYSMIKRFFDTNLKAESAD